MSEKATLQDVIIPMLELSTAHITRETSEWISTQNELSDLGQADMRLIVYPKSEYGWLILVPQDDLDEALDSAPEDLQKLVRFAAERDIRWIMLDCDASVIGELDAHDW